MLTIQGSRSWLLPGLAALVAMTSACTEELTPDTCVDGAEACDEALQGATRPDKPGVTKPVDAGGAPRPDECACTFEYAPVCGVDGNTYGNACAARCARVEVASQGECATEPCICTKEYNPVCGVDGVTYGNPCMAGCAGAEIAYEGECRPNRDECQSDADCPHGYCNHGVTCAGIDCPPPPPSECTVCGDGSQLACRALPGPCPGDQVREIVNGCYGECVDRVSCEPKAVGACRVGGCSGQLCVGPGEPDISTCEWRPEYACYQQASCEQQQNGACGWTQSAELLRCLAEAGAQPSL